MTGKDNTTEEGIMYPKLPMRILHLTDGIPPLTLGGTGRIVTEVARAQAKAGHTVGILSAAKSGSLPTNQDGVFLLTLEPKSERLTHYRCVFSIEAERAVQEKIDTFDPEVIHAHTISRQIGYRWMRHAKKSGRKIIVTCHDVSSVSHGKVTGLETFLWLREMMIYRWTWNPLRAWFIRRYLRYANRILSVSDALRMYLEKRGLQKLKTLHNGVDLSFWTASIAKDAARKKLSLPEHTFLFLLAGRMGVSKGSTLIAATLPKEAKLILAGDGFSDEFAPIQDRIFAFKNQSAEQMRVLYSAADVVLVPSRCLDCFPTVCLEAMAMERPVMATAWGGSKEAVQDGCTGWIIDPLDEDAWKKKMLWCMQNEDQMEKFGQRGRKRMEAFSLEKMLQELEDEYRQA